MIGRAGWRIIIQAAIIILMVGGAWFATTVRRVVAPLQDAIDKVQFTPTPPLLRFTPFEMYVCGNTVTAYREPSLKSEHATATMPHYTTIVSGQQGDFYFIDGGENGAGFVPKNQLCKD